MADKEQAEAKQLCTARKSHLDVPVGSFNLLTHQWEPSRTHKEWQPCCTAIQGSESQEGYMFTHCMSSRHIGHKCGLEGKELLEFVDYTECQAFDDELAKGDIYDDEEIEKCCDA